MTPSEIAKQLGSAGGKKSVKSRFSGLTKEQISATMKRVVEVRYSKKVTK